MKKVVIAVLLIGIVLVSSLACDCTGDPATNPCQIEVAK